jgi:hypothetical protein
MTKMTGASLCWFETEKNKIILSFIKQLVIT